jgi:hypothetical protein
MYIASRVFEFVQILHKLSAWLKWKSDIAASISAAFMHASGRRGNYKRDILKDTYQTTWHAGNLNPAGVGMASMPLNALL